MFATGVSRFGGNSGIVLRSNAIWASAASYYYAVKNTSLSEKGEMICCLSGILVIVARGRRYAILKYDYAIYVVASLTVIFRFASSTSVRSLSIMLRGITEEQDVATLSHSKGNQTMLKMINAAIPRLYAI